MKKLTAVLGVFLFISCNDSSGNESTGKSDDNPGHVNAAATDTLKHPSGVDNSSVISTDTAAMNVQNTLKKADSIAKEKTK